MNDIVDDTTGRARTLRALSALGAIDETQYYADMFAKQAPAKFALLIIDPRCVHPPLKDALLSQLHVLLDMGLYPSLVVDSEADRFAITSDITELTNRVRIHVCKNKSVSELFHIISDARPERVIFLQPSGGLEAQGERIPVIRFEHPYRDIAKSALSPGQLQFIQTASELSRTLDYHPNYVITSPFTLLAELFTLKGSGTLLRRGAVCTYYESMARCDKTRLLKSIENAFERTLTPQFELSVITKAVLEHDYRGGALFFDASPGAYMSKFWVHKSAQGEGLARDIWDSILENIPAFFWRSRRQNPFNMWYMKACDGMQSTDMWYIFWKGVPLDHVQEAVTFACAQATDFIE